MLEGIHTASKRAGNLTKRLLVFSRKVDSELRPVDLNQEIANVCNLLKQTLPRMIDIKLHLAEDLHHVDADPVQLEQIMMNLAVNAMDAMPEGGELTFETRNVHLDNEFCKNHLGVQPGIHVQMTISDSGHGMDQDTLEHIFEPFFTTKEKGKGTGLGLSMVYGIVKSHNGFITSRSEPGQGTNFIIYFPSSTVFLEESIGQEGSQEEIPSGDETILLVDDETPILDIARGMLARYGYETVTATSGEEAVKVFTSQKERIDLVILDLSMPGIGGYKCLKMLLEIDPEIKIIVSSGYSFDGPVGDVLKAGAAAFIAKPYQLSEMLKTVRKVLDGH
jgi:CheY-like chemotaxis protein